LRRFAALPAAFLLIIGAPAAYAAAGLSPAAVPPAVATIPPAASDQAARVHHARAQAWQAYRLAHSTALTAGIRLPRPMVIRHSKSVRRLHTARRYWINRAHRYRRVIHRRARVVHAALHELGTPYVWGGAGPGGFDCSGLVLWSYHHVGVSLPHYTWGMLGHGRRVAARSIRPADIVFTAGDGHVGIYIGRGLVVHAPHSGAVVSRVPLRSWHITAIRRIINA
jgi:cell wall-associated NlpC family hydrolase